MAETPEKPVPVLTELVVSSRDGGRDPVTYKAWGVNPTSAQAFCGKLASEIFESPSEVEAITLALRDLEERLGK